MWTHAMIADEKEAITGVQTLRNAIMVCAMLATASAYVGGRALPSILFDPSWRDTLDSIAVSLWTNDTEDELVQQCNIPPAYTVYMRRQ